MKLKKISAGFGTGFLVMLALLGIGSLVQIPYFGSLGGAIVLTAPQYILPLFILITVVITLQFLKKKDSKWRMINLFLVTITLVTSMISYLMYKSALDKSGADVSFFRSFTTEDVSKVVKDTQIYTNSQKGDVALNIYSTNNYSKSDRPVIIYIHGGGWIAGTKENNEYTSKALAKRGYVVVSVDYDLSDKDNHLYNTTEEQLTHAFAWVEKNISNYGGNTKNLFVTGDSAGGHLALELSYKINNGTYETADNITLPKVDAVSTLYPVSSPKTFYENDDLVMGNSAKNMVLSYFGEKPNDNPKAYAEATPINAISQTAPATQFLSGTRDTLVPQEATYELADALKDAGIDNNLIKLPNANHGFDILPGNLGNQAFINLTDKWFEQYKE